MLWFLLGGCSPIGRHLCIDRVVAVLLLRCVRHTLGPAAACCFGFDDGVLFVHGVVFWCVMVGIAFVRPLVAILCMHFPVKLFGIRGLLPPATTKCHLLHLATSLSWLCLAPTT